jgi:hypothetical protein
MLGTNFGLSTPPLLRQSWHLTAFPTKLLLLGILICSKTHWALNVFNKSGHSSHSILSLMGACQRNLQGCVSFKWVPANFGFQEARRQMEAKKAAGLARNSAEDSAQRGLIQKQVKDGSPNHVHTAQVYTVQ